MNVVVEKVVAFAGDSSCEVILVDGVKVAVAEYELDPDAPRLRHGDTEAWLQSAMELADRASPGAARWIRHWAQQTADHGQVDPDDAPQAEELRPQGRVRVES